MSIEKPISVIAEELAERLKQARLNRNLTQSEIAALAGVARKTVINAEKGKVQLELFVALMQALDLTEKLDLFLPKQQVSPLQLAKLQGKKRQRASGQHNKNDQDPMEVITVTYHGHHVGAVSFDRDKGVGAFEYHPGFIKTGIELSPLKMPLSKRIFSFPELDFNTVVDQ